MCFIYIVYLQAWKKERTPFCKNMTCTLYGHGVFFRGVYGLRQCSSRNNIGFGKLFSAETHSFCRIMCQFRSNTRLRTYGYGSAAAPVLIAPTKVFCRLNNGKGKLTYFFLRLHFLRRLRVLGFTHTHTHTTFVSKASSNSTQAKNGYTLKPLAVGGAKQITRFGPN